MEPTLLITLTLDKLHDLVTSSVKQALDDWETSQKLAAALEQ